jgi:predicted permease
MAVAGQKILPLILPANAVAVEIPSQLNVGFVAFVIAITGACVIVFGLAPAIIGSRINLVDAVKNGAGGSTRGRSPLRDGLVVTQFVFALSALVVTALFLRRDRAMHSMDLGFRGSEQVLLLETEISMSGYRDVNEWGNRLESVARRIAQIQGVRSVALSSFVPLGLYGYYWQPVATSRRPLDSTSLDLALVNSITPDYFELMGIPVIEGRAITEHDDSTQARVAVVNAAFAERHFPNSSAIGHAFSLKTTEYLVVGVVRNGRYDYRSIDDAEIPMVYNAWKQNPGPFVTIHLRTDGNPLSYAAAASSAIRDEDAAIPHLTPVTLKEYVGVPFVISRAALSILAILAIAALALASMGLFSVISYGVSLRTREIGIRMALGATDSAVIGIFVRGAGRLIVIGSAVGILAAIALATLVRSQVPFLPSVDVMEFVLPMAILIVFAVAAGLVPARRASRVDPARTLRAE